MLVSVKYKIKWVDFHDKQVYNRVNEFSFLSDSLKLTEKGSTPAILLLGIKCVGKTDLLKKDFQDEYLVVYMYLAVMLKFKTDNLDCFCFMKLSCESIIKACGNMIFSHSIKNLFHLLKMKRIIQYLQVM